MNNTIAIGIYAFSGLIAAISQLVLKFAAMKPNNRSGIMKYLDYRIVLSYLMLFGTIFLNMIAMRYMPYKYAPVLSSLSYVFVLLMGRFVLHETVGRKRLMGVFLIFGGMFVFYAG